MAPDFLAAFPASSALLPLLHARGHTIHASYALRMREQQKRRVPFDRPTPEEKEARLRKFFADTYLELQITDNDTGQRVASRLISLAEEGEVVLAFFRGEGVPLKMVHVEEKPWYYYYDDKVDYSRSVTLLRMGVSKPEMLVLAARGKIDFLDSDSEGMERSIYFEHDGGKSVSEYSQLDIFSCDICLNVDETTHKTNGTWEMSMRFDRIYLYAGDNDWDLEEEISFDSVLAFLEFLLKGRAVWRQTDGVKM